MVWAQIVEPQQLAKGQPPGGYAIDNRRVRMTVAKSVGLGLEDRIKIQHRFLIRHPRNDEKASPQG
jgi:hypothetical protein